MTKAWRLALVHLLVGVALMPNIGCNVISATAYFLLGQESNLEPELARLAASDRSKEVKVAIMTLTPAGLKPELAEADKELTNRLAQHLQTTCKANKEKVTVLSTQMVDRYLQEHADPDLKAMARGLGADYVILLEVDSMSLYKEGSSEMLYQAKASMTVRLVDASKSDGVDLKKPFFGQYPSDFKGGIVPVDDTNQKAFLDGFYNSIAERLSWYFTGHSTATHYRCE